MAISLNNLHTAKATNPPRILIYGPAGCHGRDARILMHDGSVKLVQDVEVGDELMGPDSKPRRVLELARGRQEMRRITPIKGDSFVVNAGHIMPAIKSSKESDGQVLVYAHRIEGKKTKGGQAYKLIRTGVDFPESDLLVDPYILGVWLGDGTSCDTAITSMDEEVIDAWVGEAEKLGHYIHVIDTDNTGKASTYSIRSPKGEANEMRNALREIGVFGNKHIPHTYLTASRDQRLALLAGLIDTDGYLAQGCYEIAQKHDAMRDGILFLARSLGLAAYSSEKVVNDVQYNLIFISGDIDMIPVNVERRKSGKRQQVKSVLVSGISAEILPEDDYYGFSLSGDHLYLTDDFTVHHNTGKTTAAAAFPNPVFLQTEDGTPGDVELNTFGHLTEYDGFVDAIRALAREDHDFNTVVTDSVESLEPLIYKRVCEENGWQSIEDPSFGKGYIAAEEKFMQVMVMLNWLRINRGMTIVYIGHSDITKFEPPGLESYNRFGLRLNRRLAARLFDEVDMVGFLNYRVELKKTETGFGKTSSHAEGGGTRWMYWEERPAFLAKNRYGLPTEMMVTSSASLVEQIAEKVPISKPTVKATNTNATADGNANTATADSNTAGKATDKAPSA